MTSHDLWLLSPELAMAGLALVVVVLDLIFRSRRLLLTVSVVGLLAPLALSIALWLNPPEPEVGMFGAMAADKFALFFHFLLIGATGGVILAAANYSRRLTGLQGEFIALMLLSVSGMMMLASARDLVTAYVSLELSALPAAALAAFLRTDRSLESGLKFLVLSAISSGVLLYGIVFIYGFTGTTDIALVIEEVQRASDSGGVASGVAFGANGLMLGVVMLIAGFGFKMAVAPFQMWVPDVYEGAPTPVVAFLSIASKAAAFAVLLRALYSAFGAPALATDWSALIAVLAAVTMTVGNLMALAQPNIKRMLGYSTVAHAGYILVGLAAVAANSETEGFVTGPQSVLFYLAAYGFTNLATFFAIIAITNRTGSDMISSFAGMARRAPMLSVLLTFGLLSLLGIPPTAGFVAKVFVFNAAIDADLAWLVVIGVINSAVSAYYYLRVVRTMFLDEPESEEKVSADIPVWAATWAASAGIAVFGIAPSSLMELAERAVIGVVT